MIKSNNNLVNWIKQPEQITLTAEEIIFLGYEIEQLLKKLQKEQKDFKESHGYVQKEIQTDVLFCHRILNKLI